MRLGRLAAFTIGLLAVLFLVGSLHSQEAGWKRYVSAPLPDGTRVTFLYPAELRLDVKGQRGFCLSRPESAVSSVRRLVPHGLPYSGAKGEYVRVAWRPLDSKSPWKLPPGKSSKRHTWDCGNGGPPRGWDILINDRATRRIYFVGYRLQREEPESFDERKRIIEEAGTPHRGLCREAAERGAPSWIRENLATLEIIEDKVFNRHDWAENLRLAFRFPPTSRISC